MEKKLEVFFGLPEEVKFCKRCVISNQRPSSAVEFKYSPTSAKKTIGFNEDGICDACLYAEKKEKTVNWADREKELVQLLDKYRRTDGRYDVLVPGSGGKDSIYAAHVLKYKYGMHPLTCTWAPHMYTEVGWENFESWIDSGFDNILCTPNGKIHRLLTRLAFINLLHPFQPFIIGQKNFPPKLAVLYDIPLVMYGENEAEYGNPIKDNLTPKRGKEFFVHEDIGNLYLGGVSVKDLLGQHGLKPNDLDAYLPLDPEKAAEKNINVQYLGYYMKWVPQENYYFSVENANFKSNTERTEGTYSKYNSIDDKLDRYHYWTTLVKFGIGRATYDASQEIRNHHLTREEGVKLVHLYDEEFPTRYFRDFLDYVSLSEKEFWETSDKFRSPHLWKMVDGRWVLRHKVT